MSRQTKTQLELLVSSLRSEAVQNRTIYTRIESENSSLKEEIDKLKKDLNWTRLLIQNLLEIMQRSTIKER